MKIEDDVSRLVYGLAGDIMITDTQYKHQRCR